MVYYAFQCGIAKCMQYHDAKLDYPCFTIYILYTTYCQILHKISNSVGKSNLSFLSIAYTVITNGPYD